MLANAAARRQNARTTGVIRAFSPGTPAVVSRLMHRPGPEGNVARPVGGVSVLTRVRSCLLVAALVAGAAEAATLEYTLDGASAAPQFEVRQWGFQLQAGGFARLAGKVTIDTAAHRGSAWVEIDAGSVSTGSPDRDAWLRGADFFDVTRFPTITFASTRLRFELGRLVWIEGDLTIRGVTRPVRFEVGNYRCDPSPGSGASPCDAEASTWIRRSDFGMTGFLASIGNHVRLSIRISRAATKGG